jgi:hypothetical protein
MRLEFPTSEMNITIFWDVMPCILIMLTDISDESFACIFRVQGSSSVEEKAMNTERRTAEIGP